MISDLSPGDKLSLKGKIFELQKRLNILDIESKRNNEMSTMFKPTIYTYSLPARERNVLDSINKAEIIKKQKKEQLKASILAQIDEGCTFTPVISNKAKSKSRQGALNDERPAHERLYQHAKQYEENKVQKSLKCKNFDFDGNRLFVPTIIKSASKYPGGHLLPESPSSQYFPGSPEMGDDQSRNMNSYQSSSNSMDNVPADEFLYQDARDRESRIRLRNQMVKEEIIATASKKKINGLSTVMLRKKAEREVRRIFSLLDSQDIGYLDHNTFANYLNSFNATKRKDTQRLWCALDIFQAGKVFLDSFLAMCIPLLYHSTVSLARQDLESSIKRLISAGRDQGFAIDEDSEGWDRLPALQTDDLEQLQLFLLAMRSTASTLPSSSSVRNEGSDAGAKNSASLISNRSRKLADQKEEKDRRLLSQLMSNANARTGPEQSECGDSAAANNYEDDYKPAPELSSSAMLFARGILMDHRKEQLRKELLDQEAELCPFRPKIVSEGFAFSPSLSKRIKSVGKASKPEVHNNETSDNLPSGSHVDQQENDISEQSHSKFSVSSGDSSLSVFNRLYGKYKYGPPPPPPPPPDESLSPSAALLDDKDIRNTKAKRDSCAALNSSFAHSKPPVVRTKPIEGYEKSVQRIRAVNEEKVRQKEMELNEWKVEDEKYRKSRELAKKGFLPFELKADKRLQEKKEKSKDGKNIKPRLIVEVRLSKTRVAKIKIRDGDNPADVADRFAKIYSLDGPAVEVLTAVVRESMLANQVAMRTTSGSVASSSTSRRKSREGRSNSINSTFVNNSSNNNNDNNNNLNSGSRHIDSNNISRDMPPVSWSGDGTQQFSSSARDNIEEESLSMYSYYDDDTVELDLEEEEEEDDEYNQSQPSESPYPNRRMQSRSSSENELDMISEEEEDEEEKNEEDDRLFTMTSTVSQSHDIGQVDIGMRDNDLNGSKLDDYNNEDSDDDDSDGFPIRQTFDTRPII